MLSFRETRSQLTARSDACLSRIAIARIAGFQPDGGSSRLCTETRAIRRSDGSARGDLRVRACRVGVSCFWLSRSTRCAANRAGLRARIAPIAAGSSDPLNVVGFGVGVPCNGLWHTVCPVSWRAAAAAPIGGPVVAGLHQHGYVPSLDRGCSLGRLGGWLSSRSLPFRRIRAC